MTRTTNSPVVVFDVNETLLDITHLEPFFVRVFGARPAKRCRLAVVLLSSARITPFCRPLACLNRTL